MQRQNVLITGSAGFIARHLISVLNVTGKYNLFHVDEIQDESDEAFWKTLPLGDRHRANVGNLTAPDLKHWEIDYVLHLAARSHVDSSIDYPVSFTIDNTVATHKLLEACRVYGKLRKFVMVSTDEVMGSLNFDDYPFRETDNLMPNSPYSASKASQEMMARAYFETYKLPVVITRCSNNYGEFQHPSKLIPKALTKLLLSDLIPVYGDGLNVRDWIHADDHSRGIELAMISGRPGEVYNFGADNELSNIGILYKVIEEFYQNRKLSKKEIEQHFIFVEDRKGHDRRYAVDSSKARRELGWRPQISFKDGIESLVKWAKNNPEWLISRNA